MKKKTLSLIIAGLIVLSCVACSKKEATDTKGSTTTAQTKTDNTTKTTTLEVNEIVGVVTDASINTISIKTNDGVALTFSTIGAEMDIANGIKEGNWVKINYTGTINGNDASQTSVLLLVDKDKNIKKEQKKVEIKDVDETVYATAGVHIRNSYSNNAKILGSLPKGSSIKRNGTCDNGWSRVEYNGKDAYIYGEYLTTTAPAPAAEPKKTDGSTPSSIHKDPDKGAGPTGTDSGSDTPAPSTSVMKGIVVSASANVLRIDSDGTDYSFDISNAAHKYKNGIQIGNEVTVTYTGDASNGPIATAVEDDNDNSSPAIKGTITYATSSSVTITTDDGAQITFSTDGATINCADGISNGIKIVVTIDLSKEVTSDNVFTATQVDDAP